MIPNLLGRKDMAAENTMYCTAEGYLARLPPGTQPIWPKGIKIDTMVKADSGHWLLPITAFDGAGSLDQKIEANRKRHGYGKPRYIIDHDEQHS